MEIGRVVSLGPIRTSTLSNGYLAVDGQCDLSRVRDQSVEHAVTYAL